MRRLLTASALFALAIFATAHGQPPTGGGSGSGGKPDEKKADKKPADPTDAAIAAALANDADVKMARAKIQLAEAELTKARQAVTLRVVTLKAKIDQLKADVRAAEERTTWATRMVEKGAIQTAELLAARDKLEATKAALALAEAEWKLLTGGAATGAAAATDPNSTAAALGLAWLAAKQHEVVDADLLRYIAAVEAGRTDRVAVKGPIPDRLRAALDKPVKLGAKGDKITFDKALEAFKKDAGLDVPVRGSYPTRPFFDPKKPNEYENRPIEIVSEGEELPVGAWFQLFEDNAVFPRAGNLPAARYRFYVREYGLLVSPANAAPPDAPALTDFWKQKPPAAKDDPAPPKK